MTLICPVCGKPFQKEKKHVNEAIRKNWTSTCSKECLKESRKNGEEVECLKCGKKFWKDKGAIEKHPNHFCSLQCSRTFKKLV